MQESLAFTKLLNSLFAGPVDALLQAVGVHPANPAAPINNTFALELAVVLCFIAFFALVRASLSVERPGTSQQRLALRDPVAGTVMVLVGAGVGVMFAPPAVSCAVMVMVPELLAVVPVSTVAPVR